MSFKNFLIIFSIFFIFTGCQTIKKKSDSIADKENKEYGKLIGKKINDLKIELGNETLVYKTKKYGIPCERKFEINATGTIVGFTSSGCI